jgi:hypothetical protein
MAVVMAAVIDKVMGLDAVLLNCGEQGRGVQGLCFSQKKCNDARRQRCEEKSSIPNPVSRLVGGGGVVGAAVQRHTVIGVGSTPSSVKVTGSPGFPHDFQAKGRGGELQREERQPRRKGGREGGREGGKMTLIRVSIPHHGRAFLPQNETICPYEGECIHFAICTPGGKKTHTTSTPSPWAIRSQGISSYPEELEARAPSRDLAPASAEESFSP